MSETETSGLGALITLFYEQFLSLYKDEDLAAVAAAATINELLARNPPSDEFEVAA